jgi:2-oxoglutarate dehydrogenase complex dehydrogenase (E1) component-like enzyme
MIDAFPFYGLDDDVSIVPNTKEFFWVQDEKENVVAWSKIKPRRMCCDKPPTKSLWNAT